MSRQTRSGDAPAVLPGRTALGTLGSRQGALDAHAATTTSWAGRGAAGPAVQAASARLGGAARRRATVPVLTDQAAYAALILLAQTRQADRDKITAAAFAAHRDAMDQRELAYETRLAEVTERERTMSEQHTRMLAQNTALTEQIAALTRDLHAKLYPGTPPGAEPR